MRPTHDLAFSLAAAFLVGCASDRPLSSAPASPTVLTGAYTATVLPSPRDCGFASAINASGAAAGTGCLDVSQPLAWSATAHTLTILDSDGPFPITITGISDNGTIVGYHSDDGFVDVEALKWRNDSVFAVDSGSTGLPNIAMNTIASFICATDCTIVGSSQAAPSIPFPPASKAAIWTTGGFRVDVAGPAGSSGAQFVAIGGGFIFGYISDGNNSTEPARYGAHGWELLPIPDEPTPNGFVTSANVSGDAVGIGGPSNGILWPSSGAPVEITPPDGYKYFIPLSINASRLVVGYLVDTAATPTTAAAYWTSQAGFRLLPNGDGGQAASVNDRGQIVGFRAGNGFDSGTPMFWEPMPAS